MADLSGYTPVYVRTTGNDSTGSGTLAAPYATAQRAFRHAWLAGNTATLASRQVTTLTVTNPEESALEITYTYWDTTTSAYSSTSTTSAAASAASAASQVASWLSDFASVLSAVASGDTVVVTASFYGVVSDSTYGGAALVFGGDLVASQSTVAGANYIPATQGTGNYVLDFGAGSFGGVVLSPFWSHVDSNTNITHAYDSDWPSRIAVRGASAATSNLGNINGNGRPYTYGYDAETNTTTVTGVGTNGRNIALTSDRSINLGQISSNGGGWDLGLDGTLSPSAAMIAGSISLTDCVASGNVVARGGVFDTGGGWAGGSGSGGNVTLVNCTIGGSVYTQAGSVNAGSGGSTSASGSVTATDSDIAGGVDAAGVTPTEGPGGHGGSVTLTRCTVAGAVNTYGGHASGTADNGAGNAGSVSATDSIIGLWVYAYGGNATGSGGFGGQGGNGGAASFTSTRIGAGLNVSCGATALGSGVTAPSFNGTVLFSGSCILPSTIYVDWSAPGFSLDITGLARGRGVNGSNILGVG